MKRFLQLSLVLLSFSFVGIAQTELPVTYSAVEIDRNVVSMNGPIQIDAANAKYYQIDGTAKGGVVIGISDQMKIPVKYIGVGEGMEDLQAFDREVFVDSLFSQ